VEEEVAVEEDMEDTGDMEDMEDTVMEDGVTKVTEVMEGGDIMAAVVQLVMG
jgi:hypothetical protein